MSKQTRLAFIFLCYLERIHELACRTTTQRQRAEKMNGTRVEMTDSNSRISEPAAHGQTVSRHAPVYTVPRRSFSAVEHPMLVQDIDKGIATFGRKFNFQEARSFNPDRLDELCMLTLPTGTAVGGFPGGHPLVLTPGQSFSEAVDIPQCRNTQRSFEGHGPKKNRQEEEAWFQ